MFVLRGDMVEDDVDTKALDRTYVILTVRAGGRALGNGAGLGQARSVVLATGG